MVDVKKKDVLLFCRNCLICSDVLSFVFAYVLGGIIFYLIRKEKLAIFGQNILELFIVWSGYFLILIPLSIFWFWYVGHYTRRRPYWDELKDVVQILSILFVLETSILFLNKSIFSRLWLATSFALLLFFLPFLRVLVKKVLAKLGRWQIPTIIIGAGPNAVDAVAALQSEPLLGFDVEKVFCFADEVPSGTGFLQVGDTAIPMLSLGGDAIATLQGLSEPNIVFALESGGIRNNACLLEDLQRNFSDIYVVPALRGLPLYGMEVNFFFRHEVLLLRLRNNLARQMPRLLKRTFDIFGSLFLLGLLSPFFLFVSWRIRTDGGSAFFFHERIGRSGKTFKCFKFRSMVVGAEKILQDLLEADTEARHEWDADYKLKNDPRITPIGAFLRRTSLDELPQLLNVLKGEMSLVGPRPIVEGELAKYGKDVNYYLEARPGMTGLWQVSGRNDTDYVNRVYLDAWYVKNWSLWYDIAILFKTFKVVLSKQGAY